MNLIQTFLQSVLGTKSNFSKCFVHMSCMSMEENGKFVQVAVEWEQTQLVHRVVEKLLVTALYL